MRVLHVIDSLGVSEGGPAQCVAQLATSQAALGDAVQVLAARDGPDGTGPRFAFPVHALGPAHGRYGYSPAASKWLRGNVSRFDAVVIHGIWQHSALAAARAATAATVPYLVYAHGALDADLPRRYPVRHLKKLAYWVVAGRAILSRARAVCFTSDMEARRATAYRGHFEGIVVGSGVDAPPVDEAAIVRLRARFPLLATGPVFVFIGRLDPIKGVDMLIEGFARVLSVHPDCTLLIVGRGDPGYRESLQSIAARLGCASRIAWAGALSGEEKWAAIRAADALVLPSHRDSFGLVVAEALAAGRVAIVSDHVGTSDAVAKYGAGFVCSDDPDGLATAMRQFLESRDRVAREQAARRCYEENFRADDAAKRLREAISRAGRAPARSSD